MRAHTSESLASETRGGRGVKHTHRKYIFIGHSEFTPAAFSDDEYVANINGKTVSDTGL